MSTAPGTTVSDIFNELPAHVWPKGARRDSNGVVSVGGVELTAIAQQYGTPVMVIDEDDFRSRCQSMAHAFGGGDKVHYASKAFLCREIARWVADEGLHLDVASPGELGIALAAGFPASRITAHGNNKTPEFVDMCVREGVHHVVVDSLDEVTRLSQAAVAAGTEVDVLVRVTPGIKAKTHEAISTSHEDQKFGFSLASGAARAACEAIAAADGLRLVGLHCHVGSQVFEADGFVLAAQRLVGLMSDVKPLLPEEESQRVLDLGGGYGIAYTAHEQPLDVDTLATALRSSVADLAREAGVGAITVVVEPGRAIAGPSTVTVYTAGTIKDIAVDDTALRRYISVDGGMSDNIRPALYQAVYEARVVNRFVDGEPVDCRLVGSHCESGDILIKDAVWPDGIAVGDLLAIPATGAYCYSMTSRYNAMLRPPVVAVSGGVARLIMRRETLDDVFALDVAPDSE